MTLLVKSRWSIFNLVGMRVTRAISAIPLVFKRRVPGGFSARFCINQQSQLWPCLTSMGMPYTVPSTREGEGLMAEPLDPQSMSNEEGAQRLADTSRHMEEVGAELRARLPTDPSGDIAEVIRHL